MALSFDQLEAITTNKIVPKVVDNAFDKHLALARFKSKQKKIDGGLKIQTPIIVDTAGDETFEYFEGADTHDISFDDSQSAITLDWKQGVGKVRLRRDEILKNAGDSGKVRLAVAKAKIAEKSFQRGMTLGLFSDGTAGTGAGTTKQLTGLRAILKSSGLYAGVNSSDVSSWAAQVKANGGTNRDLTLTLWQIAQQSGTDGGERPSVAFMRNAVLNVLWSLLQPHQRLFDSKMKDLGFENIPVFNGLTIVQDENMEANSIYMINEDFCYLAVHPEENMRVVKESSLETSNTSLTKMYWMGNLICDQRRRQVKLTDLNELS